MYDQLSSIIAWFICGLMVLIPLVLVIVVVNFIIKKLNTKPSKGEVPDSKSGRLTINENGATLECETVFFDSNIRNNSKIPSRLENKILIAMVDEQITSACAELLISNGYDVENVVGGQKVLEKLRNNEYGLVLVDPIMPYLGGVEVMEEVRKDQDQYRSPRVAIITNLGIEILKEKLPQFGFLALIGPYSLLSPEEFVTSVSRIILEIYDKGKPVENNGIIEVGSSTSPFYYSGGDYNQWDEVLKRVSLTDEQTGWVKLLQIPYKRSSLRIQQCEDETIKLFADLAIFTDKYLKSQNTDLIHTIDKLNSAAGYYNNILYTLECIAEGEVDAFYRGWTGYNNDFSFKILQDHTGIDLINLIREYIKERALRISPANEDTISKLGLTPNGMPYLWWDPEGKLRGKALINSEDQLLLRRLPYRNTKFLEIEQCRVESIKMYLRVIKALNENSDIPRRLKQIINKIQKAGFLGNSEGLPDNLYKLCENSVREVYPGNKLLNTVENINEIKNIIGKKSTEALLNVVANQKLTIIPATNETSTELFANNPFIWRVDIKELKKSLTTENYLYGYKKSKEIIEKYQSLKIIGQIYYELAEIFAKYNKIISLFYFYKFAIKTKERLEIPMNIQKRLGVNEYAIGKINLLLMLNLSDEEAIEEVKGIFIPRRKVISIDESKIRLITQQDAVTTELLGTFLSDGISVEVRDGNAITSTRQDMPITLESIFSDNDNEAVDIVFDEVQMALLKLFSENNYSVSKVQLEDFAKANNQFPNTLLSNVNQIFYNQYNDQLLSESDNSYMVDQYNIPIIKKLI